MKVAVLLAPLAGGWLAVRLWRGRNLCEPMRIVAGSLLGLGASSVLFWIWLRVFGSYGHGLMAVEAGMLGGLIYAAWRRRAGWTWWQPGGGKGWQWAAVAPGLAVMLGVFALESGSNPHGQWDAWGIWNLRARFLALGGEGWTNGLSPHIRWSHIEYPLLVPALVARCWAMTGDSGQWAPIAIHFLFTMALPVVLFAGLVELRGFKTAALSVYALVGGMNLGRYGASQYADVAVSAYMLGAALMLVLPGEHAVLAGLMAGMAAWTKNEGLAFVVVLSAAVWLLEGRKRAAVLLGGAAVLLAAVAVHKIGTGPPLDFSRPAPPLWVRLGQARRHQLVGSALFQQLFRPGSWWISPAVFLALLAAAAGLDRGAARSKKTVLVWTVLVLSAGVHLLASVAITGDVAAHLSGAADRLFLHCWPLAVFSVGLLAKQAK